MSDRNSLLLPGTALLLIAHGSREEQANADLHYIKDQVLKQRRYGTVEAAYLELAEPAILVAADACVQQGASEVILLPYFLSGGVHVLRDLTEAHAALSQKYPGVRFRLAAPLGRHPLLAEIVLERAIAAEAQ
jgi:sirohydrochlorin ferrochelatase